MNEEFDTIPMDLKYCEACGALWLRPRNSPAPYCRRCENLMAELSRSNQTPAERKPS